MRRWVGRRRLNSKFEMDNTKLKKRLIERQNFAQTYLDIFTSKWQGCEQLISVKSSKSITTPRFSQLREQYQNWLTFESIDNDNFFTLVTKHITTHGHRSPQCSITKWNIRVVIHVNGGYHFYASFLLFFFFSRQKPIKTESAGTPTERRMYLFNTRLAARILSVIRVFIRTDSYIIKASFHSVKKHRITQQKRAIVYQKPVEKFTLESV